MSESFINLEAVSACGIECLEAIDSTTEIEDFFRFWSDISNWPDDKLPEDDSEVEIKPFWNMILDIEVTPLIKMLKVHGKLTFSDDIDVHLRVKHVSIRGGEFIIGSVLTPYTHNAKITLLGTKEENG